MKQFGKLTIIVSAVALTVLLCGCRKLRQEPAITIIGGADGSTAIWVSDPGKDGARCLEQDFGTYEASDGFVEDAVHSTHAGGEYVSQTDEKNSSSPTSSS